MKVIVNKRVAVPQDFLGVHSIGASVTYNHRQYVGDPINPVPDNERHLIAPEPANYKGLSYRLYGTVHPSEVWGAKGAPFNWAHYDKVFAKFRSAGTPFSVNYTNFNLPAFLQSAPYDGGAWTCSLPRDKDEWLRFMRAMLERYEEIDIVEVANEVFTPKVGTYWRGSVADLATFCDWNLDLPIIAQQQGWKLKRKLRIWAPSIPGFLQNDDALIAFLKTYRRRTEFDAVSAHFYYTTHRTLGLEAGLDNHHTCARKLRRELDKIGMAHIPIADGEHGIGEGVTPVDLFNTAVYAATEMGFSNLTYFSTSQRTQDEAFIGTPAINKPFRDALEAAALALNGRTILRVEDPEDGGFYRVVYENTQTRTDPVTILPPSGEYDMPGDVTVTMRTPTPDARILYAFSGGPSNEYNGPFRLVSFPAEITAWARADGMEQSAPVTVKYERKATVPWPKPARPTLGAPTGTVFPDGFPTDFKITAPPNEVGILIWWSTDGDTPGYDGTSDSDAVIDLSRFNDEKLIIVGAYFRRTSDNVASEQIVATYRNGKFAPQPPAPPTLDMPAGTIFRYGFPTDFKITAPPNEVGMLVWWVSTGLVIDDDNATDEAQATIDLSSYNDEEAITIGAYFRRASDNIASEQATATYHNGKVTIPPPAELPMLVRAEVVSQLNERLRADIITVLNETTATAQIDINPPTE